MTRRTFYRKLRKIAGGFNWKIHEDGLLRGSKYGALYCPITVVCQAEVNKYYHAADFNKAADKLGLSLEDASLIAVNADYSGINPQVRKTLLKSVGLTEETQS